MNIYIAFFLGLLIGWLIEWVLDFFYWRKRSLAGVSSPTPVSTAPANGHSGREVTEHVGLRRDDLKLIKGIGLVIEGRLNQAGVYTFEQLGNLSAIQLREVLGSVIQRLSDEESLLEQARRLARPGK